MKNTFQSFVFGCRVNEAERIKIDKQLVEAGYSVDLASPSFLIINSCAITGKAEREAKQLIYQLRKKHPEAKIVLTGCSATVWSKYNTAEAKLVDILIPNDKKSSLISLLQTDAMPLADASSAEAVGDKFRYSNRLLVKIQDGCHRFCTYCIVPYLRGLPQSQKIADIVSYINSFSPLPSEVILSAINTESFGTDTGETLVNLIKQVLKKTKVPRIAFGSIHPWSLTNEFINYFRDALSGEKRFVQFLHIPIQSGSPTVLKYMRREYDINKIEKSLNEIHKIHPSTLLATDVIVGFLGETKELFEETYSFLDRSPISRLHVFRFSNRAHTAAFYLKKQLAEPTAQEKKIRSERLIALSRKKYQKFIEIQIGRTTNALVIAKGKQGMKILLDNQVEGILTDKQCLPGELVHVTIIAAKDGLVVCKES
ncbi:MAG: MiaB/RimO family radical SAM methylthiotransferase [Candidatus Roizmanbacteria bacterium]|nr:MiaB/RimO family radical SAM methylthiotransferase [Candidatus Roizmanbacteria bacterium]